LIILSHEKEKIFGAHLKLHPGINYSHTTDKIITAMPRLMPLGRYLLFDRTETELDWNYPFDFCGSIYLLDRVVSIMDAIEDKEKIRKPNTFEYAGNLAMKKSGLEKNQKLCLCLNKPAMTVITVNKVQEVYDTPVYDFKPSSDEEGDALEIMNRYMREGRELDFENYYAKQQFNSVHIGDFKLKPLEES
jgi:hypothetical protein